MSPSVTVVMATFNGERYLREQIDSLITQTVSPKKIIVIDDHSSDQTVSLLHELLDNCPIPNMIIEHEMNKGVSKSFQDGIELSSTDYIMICDQDDVWDSRKIELCLKVMSSEDAMVVCNAEIVDNNLKSKEMTMFEYIRLPIRFSGDMIRLSPEKMLRMSLKRNYVTGMCMMIRADLAKKAMPAPSSMTYDTWISWVVSSYGSVVFLNKTLVLYRQHNNNVIGTQKSKEELSNYYQHRHKDKINQYRKYMSLVEERNSVSLIEKDALQAAKFYKQRLDMDSYSVFKGVKVIFVNLIKGNYRKFTPSGIKEVLKDFAGLFYSK
ncbi:Glycosyl transferase family 2 [Lachnospiraceae bacterium RM5]|nr:Glycosyl transferase family 2 [Lachnospiraceae bacterium RM5]